MLILKDVYQEYHIKEDNHYKNLINLIPIGTYLFVSSQDGSMRFDFVSPKFCQIYGRAEEDFLRDPSLAFSVTHPEDSESLIKANQYAIETGESFHWEGRFIVNEKIIWVEINSESSLLPNGDMLWSGIINDISERMRHKEILHKSEEKYRLAMEATQDGLWDWDATTGYVYYSPSWRDIISESNVNNDFSSWESRIHPDDKARVAHSLNTHLECKTKTWKEEHRLRNSDGAWVWVLGRGKVVERDEDGNPLRMIGTMTDISERKESEEALLKSSKEWSFAMDFFDDAIYLIDLDDKLVRANRTFYMMTGLTPELAVGQDITSIIHPEGEEVPCPVCMARKERRDEVIIMEADHPDNPAGKPIQVTVQVIRDNEGSPLSVLMGIRDLSSIRSAEEENAKLQHQLHQSQKMDALGKLTGGIAHDYNNMLGVVMGYADLLEDALDKQPELAEYAHEIYHASERGNKLTNKLLAFSRQTMSEANYINLNSLLLSQQHMLEKTLTVRIELVLNLAEDLWTTWINGSEMEDIILNISINAMHAIDGNGQLIIRTSNEHLNQLDAQSFGITSGDYVLVSMTDTGCGMDEAIKEKIFEPFFSTKGKQGTGLGLSQVYGFVHSSGGAISVYSEPNQGAQFSLYFPRHDESEHKEQAAKENKSIDVRGTETILLVDDEPALLGLNCEILARQGFNVIAVESAKKALEILEHEMVDLLLSDILMPAMDGYQLAAIVKEKYPSIKIQLISGFTDELNMGMVDENLQKNILFKPFNSQSFLQRINELLNE